uniref:Reverse transcriptase domain-containing protein n=1 Tax=Graphocephala atropunctata TaxID=36148 RepID=A0A1B6M063_9HEMI
MAESPKIQVVRGVPQGSVLGPVLFLLFINDLPKSPHGGDVCLFADDTSLSVSARNRPELEVKAYEGAGALQQWFDNNRLSLNIKKTQIIEFQISCRSKKDALNFFIDETEAIPSAGAKFLGIFLDENLKFYQQIDNVCKRLGSGIFVLKRLTTFADSKVLLAAYYGLIYPFLAYGVAVWGHESVRSVCIFKLQKRALRVIFRKPHRFSCRSLFRDNDILTFPSIYIFNTVLFVRKNYHLFVSGLSTHQHNLRGNRIAIPSHRTGFFEKHLIYNGTRLYNSLPGGLKEVRGLEAFKKGVRRFLVSQCYYSVGEYLMSHPG